MSAFPINTVMFSGFGDSGVFNFRDPSTWGDLGQPGSAPTTSNGHLIGIATVASGAVAAQCYLSSRWATPVAAAYRLFAPTLRVDSSIPDTDTNPADTNSNVAADGLGNTYFLRTYIDGVTKYAIRKVAYQETHSTALFNGYTFDAFALQQIAVNQAGTLLYVGEMAYSGAETPTIYVIDLATGVRTTFKASAGLGGHIGPLLVLPAGSVIVSWGADTTEAAPKRYAPNGSLLTTYNALPSTYSEGTGIAHAYVGASGPAPIDGDSFFFGYYSSAPGYGVSVVRVRVSDGSIEGTEFQTPDDGFEYDGPFTALRVPIATSVGSLSGAYFRLFNGQLLTLEQAEKEANAGVAVAAGVTTDTPLIALTDLTDVSQPGTGHAWHIRGGALETFLPGPLTADTSFMLLPEGDSPYGSGSGNPTLVVTGLATTSGSPLNTSAVNAIIDPTDDPTVAMCARREGGWWQACDNAGRGNKTDFIDFGLPGPTHLLASDVLACNGPLPSLQVRRDLLELPTKDLVSVVRSTMNLTRFARLGGTAVQSYSLIITSALGLDAAVNTAGNRILYLNVEDGSVGPTEVKAYALDTDTDLGGLFRIPGVAWSLVWLPDCTFLVVVQVDALVNVQRYNLRGRLVRTYDLGTLPVGDGVCGIAASVAQDRLWVVTAWDNGESPEQPAVIRFKLSTGELLGPEVPLLGQLTAYTGIACMTQPYYENKCVPVAPPPSSVRQWALERFDLTDRQEQTS